jgi:TetR/AcrR family transcriptional repressor for divergent bdcA
MSRNGSSRVFIVLDTQIAKSRGRPRGFDMDAALAIAQAMFHDRGYDGVGVAAITEALGIKAPSFYAAFGSKAGLFEQVLDRYDRSALPVDDLLRPEVPVADAVAALFEAAAHIYAADPRAAGCLVLESARAGGEAESAVAAQRFKELSRNRLRDFVAAHFPDQAEAVADYTVSTMSGLSAGAREKWSEARLLGVARLAGSAIKALLA